MPHTYRKTVATLLDAGGSSARTRKVHRARHPAMVHGAAVRTPLRIVESAVDLRHHRVRSDCLGRRTVARPTVALGRRIHDLRHTGASLWLAKSV